MVCKYLIRDEKGLHRLGLLEKGCSSKCGSWVCHSHCRVFIWSRKPDWHIGMAVEEHITKC